MALVDDIKLSLRVSTDALDPEVRMLAEAAVYDMRRAGVNPDLLPDDADAETDGLNAFVKTAITAYCKAHFGYDVTEAHRFAATYESILNRLLNSAENIAAIAEEPAPEDGESG